MFIYVYLFYIYVFIPEYLGREGDFYREIAQNMHCLSCNML